MYKQLPVTRFIEYESEIYIVYAERLFSCENGASVVLECLHAYEIGLIYPTYILNSSMFATCLNPLPILSLKLNKSIWLPIDVPKTAKCIMWRPSWIYIVCHYSSLSQYCRLNNLIHVERQYTVEPQ